MRSFGLNFKKGNAVIDSIVIVIILFVFAIASIYGAKLLDEVNDDIQSDTDMDATSKAVTNNFWGKYASLFDNLFMFVFVLLVVFVIVSVFMLDTHPIFFILTVILLIAVFVAVLLLANVFNDIMIDDSISTYANMFTYTSWILTHFVETIIGVSFMVLIALFTKFR